MNIVLYPNAKINIGLRIVGKRPDGFHDLETLFYPVLSMTDILEICESDRLTVNYYGKDFELPGNDIEKELCVKAYRMLEKEFGLPPVAIHLYKGIPSGAGLGGGSSDASSTLSGLNELFGLGLTPAQLAKRAERLGSDCPFFLYDEPMIGKGRGELLTPFHCETTDHLERDYKLKIVTPDIKVSTAEAYAGIVPDPAGKGLEEKVKMPVSTWRTSVGNDFEKGIFQKFPELGRIKDRLYEEGAVYASMSGSGSAVYGLFLAD